jgi:hypothetical protein
MINRHFLFIVLFFGCATMLSASTLVWDRTEVNLDMGPDQKDIRTTCTGTNIGAEAVRIARIKTACGCTGSSVDKKIIGPGESTTIIATFNKGARQGLNRKKLQVFIDDHEQPVASLTLNVNIPTLIKAVPQLIYWNSTSSKTPRRVGISLEEKYVDEIERIEYDQSQLIVTEEPGAPDSDENFVLVIEPKDYEKNYRGSITIYATGSDGRKANTRLHTFVQP